jgi:AcrR family transcriptional regulator
MPRATPLPPGERRAALIEATLPLLRRHGRDVSTRQIAEAAGVAEGTIFRAFPSKEALIDAAIETALDPSPTRTLLGGIDTGADLPDRVVAAVSVLQERIRDVFTLLMAMRMMRPPADGKPLRRPPNTVVLEALTEFLAPHAAQLRLEPAEVARLVWLVTFSATHPLITDDNPLTAEQIADVLLDGVRLRPGGQ